MFVSGLFCPAFNIFINCTSYMMNYHTIGVFFMIMHLLLFVESFLVINLIDLFLKYFIVSIKAITRMFRLDGLDEAYSQ